MSNATKAPYTDYLVNRLGPALWEHVAATLKWKALVLNANVAQQEALLVIQTVPAKLFGEPRQWKEARGRAETLANEWKAYSPTVQASAAAFDAAFEQGIRISAAATQDDLDSARVEVRSVLTEGSHRLILRKTSQDRFAVSVIAVLTGITFDDAAEVVKSVEYVGPAEVVGGVSLDQAIQLKNLMEGMECVVSIAEGPPPGEHKRQAIPESVRHEVWRRDGGACVDCGSRERLEFDHIVPVSKGGANTARNIELRCETCNRTKAAKI